MEPTLAPHYKSNGAHVITIWCWARFDGRCAIVDSDLTLTLLRPARPLGFGSARGPLRWGWSWVQVLKLYVGAESGTSTCTSAAWRTVYPALCCTGGCAGTRWWCVARPAFDLPLRGPVSQAGFEIFNVSQSNHVQNTANNLAQDFNLKKI